jgi:hypothetical protein
VKAGDEAETAFDAVPGRVRWPRWTASYGMSKCAIELAAL